MRKQRELTRPINPPEVVADTATQLTAKQKKFADEYLIDLNATQAAIRAGYAPKSAFVTGSKLLSNSKVAQYLSERRRYLESQTEVTVIRVIRELAIIAFSNLDDYRVDTQGNLVMKHGIPAERMRAIAAKRHKIKKLDGDKELVECDIKLWDKTKALDMLCKHLGIIKGELPPLEFLLSKLPHDVAQIIRGYLTGAV
jgi:phage terminase small subunit